MQNMDPRPHPTSSPISISAVQRGHFPVRRDQGEQCTLTDHLGSSNSSPPGTRDFVDASDMEDDSFPGMCGGTGMASPSPCWARPPDKSLMDSLLVSAILPSTGTNPWPRRRDRSHSTQSHVPVICLMDNPATDRAGRGAVGHSMYRRRSWAVCPRPTMRRPLLNTPVEPTCHMD